MVLWHKAQNLMRNDGLPPDIRQALIDRFEGFELAEILSLDTETLIDALDPDTLEEKLPVLREALDMEPEEETDGRD